MSEIVATECHFGYGSAEAPGLRGFVLTPDGSVTRVTTPGRNQVVLPVRGESANETQTANIGPAAYRALATRFVHSRFFALGPNRIQHQVIGMRGMRISVTRDGRRTLWSAEHGPMGSDELLFFDLYKAVYDVANSRRLTWRTIRAGKDPLSICGATREN